MDRLLWIDALIHLFLGSQLLFFTRRFIAWFGLPQTDTPFYPRLLGAILFGIGWAILLGVYTGRTIFLGPGAEIILSLAGAAAMAYLLWVDRGSISARGKASLGFLIFLLLTLSLLQYRLL